MPKYKDSDMHPEIEKFWSGDNVWFDTMENPVDPYKKGSDMNILYCRNVRESKYASRYTVVAKSLPYPRGTKPTDNICRWMLLARLPNTSSQ